MASNAIRQVVVMGGGSAGWLTAAVLAADHPADAPGGLRVTLVESPDVPIIGVGGILSVEDAVSKIRAGADVVQIYTGLIYEGPALVAQAARAIKAAGR